MIDIKIDIDHNLPPLNNIKILLAEDNMVSQFLMNKILKAWQIEVEVAENGIKVLEMLKLNDYDLILMDTHMPVMGGYETTKRIRSEFDAPKCNTKILSLSATFSDEDKKAALEAGMDDILSKPFVPEQLHQMIKDHTKLKHDL